MKRMTMIGIALTAMLATAALVGAASASATVLCKENTAACSVENTYPSGTGITASLKGNLELGGSVSVSCTGSALSGKTKAEKGSPLPIEVTSLTLSGCTSACGKSVTAEATGLPYSGSLARGTEGNGTLTLSNGGAGNRTLKFLCAGFTCGYSVDGLQLGFDGGNPATMTAAASVKRVEGFSIFCGNEASLSASYEVTGPNPAHATALPGANDTVFCKEAGSVCPSSGAFYPKETAVEGKAVNASLGSIGLGETTCSSSAVALKNTAAQGSPLSLLVSSMSFSGCAGGQCTSAKAINLPFGWSASATSGGNGLTTMNFNLEMTCQGATCVYEAVNDVATFNGGATPGMELKFLISRIQGSPINCGNTRGIDIDYDISTPTPLYMSKAEA